MKVLVFGAHPDDAEIGMGGTIARYTRLGHQVMIVVSIIPNNKEIRLKESEKAAKILDAELKILDIDPNKFKVDRINLKLFDDIIKDYSPDIAYTCWYGDSHQDHNVTTRLVIAASRKNKYSLYMYEHMIPGGLTPYCFKAQSFVDISDIIGKKIEAIKAHASQLTSYGDDLLDYIIGKATYRGYQISTKYAEVFEIIKEIKSINPNK